MSMIRGKDTKPEINLRKLLSSNGVGGYRINSKIQGKPDLIFPKYRIAVFVDGCFWHKCPDCYIEPRNNKKYWKDKINNNVKRDKRVNTILKNGGWVVLRFWEHLLRKDPTSIYKGIMKKLIKGGYCGHKNT